MQLPAESSKQSDRDAIERLKKTVEFCIRSNPRQALEVAEEAIQFSSRIDDPIATAIALRAKAAAVHTLGKYAESLNLWDQARTIYVRNGFAVDAATVERSMVDALMYLGRYEDALETASQARATFIEFNDTIALARLDANVGNVYHRLDRNAEALEYYERALTAFRALGDSFGIALTSYNAANIYCNLHEFADARQCYRLAENLYQGRGMDLAAARARYSLGYLEFMTGNYHQAMRTLRQIEPEFERLGDIRMAALCRLDLAEICLQMNVLDDAAALADRANESFKSLGMRYEQAKSIMFRGLAMLGLCILDDADRLLAEAHDLFIKEQNALYIGLTSVYRSELELKRGSPDRALRIVAEARAAFERTDLGAKQLYARLVEAKALKAAGAPEGALQKCLEIIEPLNRVDALWLKTELNEFLGDLYLDDGNRPEAYRHFLATVESIEQRRASIRVDDFRSAFMGDKLRVYEKLVRLCLAHDTPEQTAQAFYYVESQKARTLVDMITNDLDLWPVSASMDSERRAWNRLREELHWLYAKIRVNEAGGDSRLIAARGGLASLIKAKENELERLALRAQAADSEFAVLRGQGGLTIEEVRRALGEDDILLEYFADGGRLSVFLIDRASVEVIRLPAAVTDVRDRVFELKFLMEKFQYGSAYVLAHDSHMLACVNDLLKWFHDNLFAPLADRVRGKDLVIVPCDVLHSVPFHTLFDGEQYLIEHSKIAYAPSARLYTMCCEREVQPRQRISVFGVPDGFAPHIRTEVETIRRWFPDARSFVDGEATRDSLERIAGSTDVLHIASHAVFRQDNPMFSAFKLSDQWMNAYDICSLRMKSALVTLSGCSTGAGRVYAGDETLGLVRSFLRAGASSLVVSLWTVNDPSAAALMSRFYEDLARGTGARAALQSAILDAKARYSNPYYWAPFVLIGRD